MRDNQEDYKTFLRFPLHLYIFCYIFFVEYMLFAIVPSFSTLVLTPSSSLTLFLLLSSSIFLCILLFLFLSLSVSIFIPFHFSISLSLSLFIFLFACLYLSLSLNLSLCFLLYIVKSDISIKSLLSSSLSTLIRCIST